MDNIILNQSCRYYHLIAFKGSLDVITSKFYRAWNITSISKETSDLGVIKYLQMTISDISKIKGIVNSYFITKDQQYIFDLVFIDYEKIGISILCFPLKKIAIDLTKSLVSDYKLLSKSNFIKVDTNNLVYTNDKQTDIFFNENHFFFGGVFFSITGDSFLSTVKLTGDKPLDSDIYKAFFKNRKMKYGVEKVIVHCKTGINQNTSTKLTSRIHMDKIGNYSLYIQERGKNIPTILSTFEMLDYLNCLIETPINPTIRLLKGNDDEQL